MVNQPSRPSNHRGKRGLDEPHDGSKSKRPRIASGEATKDSGTSKTPSSELDASPEKLFDYGLVALEEIWTLLPSRVPSITKLHSKQERSIWHAIAALGAIYQAENNRNLESVATRENNLTFKTIAARQYKTARCLASERLKAGNLSLQPLLIVYIIFMCVAVQLDRYEMAAKHLDAGSKQLDRSWDQMDMSNEDNSAIALVYYRFGLQSPWPWSRTQLENLEGHFARKASEIPASFKGTEQAREHLDTVHRELLKLRREARDAPDSPEVARLTRHLYRQIIDWHQAFIPLRVSETLLAVSKPRSKLTVDVIQRITLEMLGRVSGAQLCKVYRRTKGLSPYELSCDFDRLIRLARVVTDYLGNSKRAGFQIFAACIPVLSFAIFNCFDPEVLKRALEELKRCSKECLWNAADRLDHCTAKLEQLKRKLERKSLNARTGGAIRRTTGGLPQGQHDQMSVTGFVRSAEMSILIVAGNGHQHHLVIKDGESTVPSTRTHSGWDCSKLMQL